jgi:PAN domain
MTDTGGGRGGFWSTLPGLLTGIAAVIGAGTAAIVAMRSNPTSATKLGVEQHPPVQPEAVPAPNPVVGQKKFIGPMGPLEVGISYNQGDIYDNSAASAQDCAKMCADDDRCLAVTYIISQKRCWVKNQTLSVGASPDMVSSRKLTQ